MWLLIAFIVIPLIEIGLFIQVGGWLGLFPTLVIVVLTAIAGSLLVRSQGLQALRRLQSSFDRLENPTRPLADGAMILVSGLLLLTPGFFTDAVGFALLVPGVRAAVFRAVRSRIKVREFRMGRPVPPQAPGRPPAGDVIEGEFEPVTPPGPEQPSRASEAPRRPSGWTKP